MEGRDLRAAYEEDLNRLKTAQRDAAIADLQNTRNQALSNLEAERTQNAATYNQQRSTANAQNRMSARNFQEYLAQTGRANSGLSAQARMQNANNLNTNLNYLNAGEAGALADINRRTTLANDAYNTGLAGANAQIEANYIQNLLNERDKELQRDLAERQFQEQIRQFNENLALQRAQLYSRFSGGSGGRGSTGSSGDDDLGFTDTTDTSTSKSSGNSGSKAGFTSVAQGVLAQDKLNKMAKTDNFDIGEVRTKNGGLASVKVYTVNGVPYYKSGNAWVPYR